MIWASDTMEWVSPNRMSRWVNTEFKTPRKDYYGVFIF
jgi:hypothetical protein